MTDLSADQPRVGAQLLRALLDAGRIRELDGTVEAISAALGEQLGAPAVDLWTTAGDGTFRCRQGWARPPGAEMDRDGWVTVQADPALTRVRASGAGEWIGATGGTWTAAVGLDETWAGTLLVPLMTAGAEAGMVIVVGVAACHLPRPPENLEAAGRSQLWRAVGDAVAVALSAERLRARVRLERDQTAAVRERESSRVRISFAQHKLLDASMGKSSSRTAHLADILASALGRGVLVVDGSGAELACAGGRGDCDRLAAAVPAALRGSPPAEVTARLLSPDSRTGAPSGAVLLAPPITAREVDADRLVGSFADLLSTKMGMFSSEGQLIDVVKPLALLGLCSRESNQLRRWDLADLLLISPETALRVASVRTPTPEAAFRCATAVGRAHEAALGVVAAAALGHDVVVLLRAGEDLTDRIDRLRGLLTVTVSIGVSAELSGVAAVPAGYRESQVAVVQAEPGSAAVFHDDAPRLHKVMQDLAAGGQLVARRVLGPVLDLGRADREQVLAVLHAAVEHDGEMAAVAAALGESVEAVTGILARATALTRLDLRTYQDVTTLCLALEQLRQAGNR